jgi:hypothetical protein
MNQDDAETRRTQDTPKEEGARARRVTSAPSLADLLSALKEQRPEAAALQVDDDIADLEKLIADANAAKASYDEEAFNRLAAEQNRLIGEKDALKRSLVAALEEVEVPVGDLEKIEGEQLCVVLNAKQAVEDAEALVETKKATAKEKSEEFADAKASLDLWRKPADSIAKRHKRAQTLIDEIKKLRNGPKRGEAYWKLALGCPQEITRFGCPEGLSVQGCPEAFSEQDFLHKVLDLPPPIVDPADLETRITAAWTEFTDARRESVKANVDLENAEAILKTAKAEYADKSKNLIKAIAEALAVREAASDGA